MKEAVAARRLVLFYYRENFQTMLTSAADRRFSDPPPDRLWPYTGVCFFNTWQEMLDKNDGLICWSTDDGPSHTETFTHNFAELAQLRPAILR